jgi:ribosomal protein L29
MTPKEIRKKKPKDLKVLVNKLREELSVTKLNIKMGDIAALSKARQMKTDIARILTVLTEQEKGEAVNG